MYFLNLKMQHQRNLSSQSSKYIAWMELISFCEIMLHILVFLNMCMFKETIPFYTDMIANSNNCSRGLGCLVKKI